MDDDTDSLAVVMAEVSLHQLNIPSDPEEFQRSGDLILPAITYLTCREALHGAPEALGYLRNGPENPIAVTPRAAREIHQHFFCVVERVVSDALPAARGDVAVAQLAAKIV